MTRIAFICLGSYHIDTWTKEQNFDRQSVYSIALSQALNLAKHRETLAKNLACDFFIVDNTVSSGSQVIDELKSQFSDPLIQDVQYINNNNLGSKNKGAGEYIMCRAVIEKHRDALAEYDWVIYYTMRQIIVEPRIHKAIYEATTLPKVPNVLVSNPIYLYADGTTTPSAKGNFCDMIFAMSPQLFFGYIESMKPEELISKKMNSEQNLFEYIDIGKKDGTIICQELTKLGIMRYNYAINKTELV